jgi:DNA-binding PucR family transcriptional regulator
LFHKHNSLLEFFDEAKRQEFFEELSDEEEFFDASSSAPSASKSEGKYSNLIDSSKMSDVQWSILIFLIHNAFAIIHIIRFDMHMNRPDKSENIFAI